MFKSFKQLTGRLSLTKTKSLILASLLVGAVIALLSSPGKALGALGQQSGEQRDSFGILLKGIYKPVGIGGGPQNNLGLRQVDLSDGSFSTVKINRLPEDTDKPVGNFYVQFAGGLCAYDIPGGSFAARFVGSNATDTPDNQGGVLTHGTFDLDILEATGRFSYLAGGHIHMVDILHQLADGNFQEHCFCLISRL